MKKSIALFLVFALLTLSGNLFAKEKRGANIEIYKKKQIIKLKMEGTPWEKLDKEPDIRGELLAARKTSLLLLERDSYADVTVDIGDIGVIRIVKKWGAGEGFLIGSAVGAVLGGSFGYAYASSFGDQDLAGSISLTALTGGLAIGLLGGIISGLSSKYETFQFTGKSDLEIQEILEYLRKKARVRNTR